MLDGRILEGVSLPGGALHSDIHRAVDADRRVIGEPLSGTLHIPPSLRRRRDRQLSAWIPGIPIA